MVKASSLGGQLEDLRGQNESELWFSPRKRVDILMDPQLLTSESNPGHLRLRCTPEPRHAR